MYERMLDKHCKPSFKEFIDKKYPCGEGGWIHYRVLTEQNLEDIKKLLRIKSKSKPFV